MIRGLRTKKGSWVKMGARGAGASFPGSYGNYVYLRAPPKDYAKTAQQKRIASIGYCVQEKCTGKTGSAFLECRRTCTG